MNQHPTNTRQSSRRDFFSLCSAMGISTVAFPAALVELAEEDEPITTETIAQAERIAGIELTEAERETLLEGLTEFVAGHASRRAVWLGNQVAPALVFDPQVSGVGVPVGTSEFRWTPTPVDRPSDDESLAFSTVSELSWLLKNRDVSSTELTELYLSRLKEYDPVLEAVVTLTEELAFRQARKADEELDSGLWRGPLHGVPYGAKDLLSVRGYPTTWGAMPYRDQVIDADATVVQKLENAGAVLVAKLTLGALAWGDVWFGGKTKNPWNIEEGSSGSSAGPGATVSAGLVGFAIGSETWGSIVSPSNRNGVTGLRPSFGHVSRHGAMALSWSMDKLGPMARSALDCAIIFDSIRGADQSDPASRDIPFHFDPGLGPASYSVGYYADAFDERDDETGEYYGNRDADLTSLEVLSRLGFDLKPLSLPSQFPTSDLSFILSVESAAAFDELLRNRGVDAMVSQDRWPKSFKQARLIPAVDYVQANRIRTLLMREMARAMEGIDVFVSPSFGGDQLLMTNLTGHPAVCVPNAFHKLEDQPGSPRREPGSISFIGGLYQDGAVLSVAQAYQSATGFHRMRPPIT